MLGFIAWGSISQAVLKITRLTGEHTNEVCLRSPLLFMFALFLLFIIPHTQETDAVFRVSSTSTYPETRIVSNYIAFNALAGIVFNIALSLYIADNIVSDNGRYSSGITIDYDSQVELHDNTVTMSANYGVGVLASSFVTLNDNTLNDNNAGTIWIDDTSQTVSDATLTAACG
jgi:parallel beta-helix repeat protein